MTSDKPTLNMNDAFSLIRQRFEQSLAQRADAMLALTQQPVTEDNLKDIAADAHKLAGASGTFGYAVLGNLARQLELQATALRALPAASLAENLPLLQQQLQLFKLAVTEALYSGADAQTSTLPGQHIEHSIWLMLDNTQLLTELQTQLDAFGHKVLLVTDFDSCVQLLKHKTPALLFSHIIQADGKILFQQNLLLNLLKQHQSRLLVFSEQDDFALRVQAAQHFADDFFISPLDIPNMLSRITELLEQASVGRGRVFIVDDDKLLAEHYALVLNSVGVKTAINHSPRTIIEELLSFQPDLILMDMYMPDYTGAELAGVIRQYPSLRRLPIVFLSSEQNKSLQIRAMSHGADDFITKPISDLQLAQAIKVRLARSLQIKNLIEKDSLTSLIKHSAIKEVADLEFERAERQLKPLSIVMLDIDHFKAVNDSFGHATGDVVITALATLLRKRIRKTDRAGRYGGEEFMLVLPDCTAVQARQLTEHILQAFSILHFNSSAQQFSCSFSAGVASTSDSSFINAEQMIVAADEALYRAKAAGRNQVC
ncbi:diguanylate cyclase [Arsukibacterium sp.]|uniref:diguanylate cyclase n=1 Tax=Arsukibacterium sp. TaxID=1977258 RepID=UPI002FD94119